MTFRKEKKFKLTIMEFYQLRDLLLKSGMQLLYESRQVNSLYYDNDSQEMYHNSQEGVLPRKKIRIRWYSLNKRFSLETKISSFEGRYKKTKLLKQNCFADFPKVLTDEIYGVLTPSLVVSYEREYYSIKGMRITFDSSIKYRNCRLCKEMEFEDHEWVMEVKSGVSISDDFMERVLPYATTRFSKYSRGLIFSQGEV